MLEINLQKILDTTFKEMNNSKMEKQLLDINDCAAYLGISKNTLYSWVNQRKIPYLKCGSLLRFNIKDIDTWLNKNKVKEINFT